MRAALSRFAPRGLDALFANKLIHGELVRMFRDDFTSISLSSVIDMPREYLRDIETRGRTRRKFFLEIFCLQSLRRNLYDNGIEI